MPALASMTEEGLALLDDMPSFMYEDPTTRAVCHVWAKEAARMRENAEAIQSGFIPKTSSGALLEAWEGELHLTRNPDGLDEAARRDRVVVRLRGFITDPSGSAWVLNLRQRIGTGWTYEEDEDFTLRFELPWPSGSPNFLAAQRAISEERPAAWDFFLSDSDGFNLDISQMDSEPLGR